jgi:tripartite ATP-independent transporter DctP family solute receptor
MKQGLKLSLVFILMIALLALTACGSKDAKGSSEQVVLKIAAATTNDPITYNMELFKERLEKNSDGRIKVEVYPSGQLGGGAQVLEQVQLGNVQIYVTNTPNISGFNELIQVVDLPYLFPDVQAATEYMNNEGYKYVEEKLNEKDLTVLAYFEYGPRVVLSKKEITSMEDIDGMKIRTLSSPVLADQWNAYGGAGVPMGVAELFTALQQGAIDGVESSPGFFYSGKYFESADFIVMEPNGSQVTTFSTSKKWFDSLPEDLQKIIRDTAQEIIPEVNEFARAEAIDSVKKMQEEGGIEVIESSPEFHKAMVAASEQVYEELYKRVPEAEEWVKEIRAKFPKQ